MISGKAIFDKGIFGKAMVNSYIYSKGLKSGKTIYSKLNYVPDLLFIVCKYIAQVINKNKSYVTTYLKSSIKQ